MENKRLIKDVEKAEAETAQHLEIIAIFGGLCCIMFCTGCCVICCRCCKSNKAKEEAKLELVSPDSFSIDLSDGKKENENSNSDN